VAFNLTTPRNVCQMFGSWLNQFGGKLKRQALAGASAFFWAIWLSRNEVVFDKSPTQSLLRFLFRGTHWLRFWTPMERHDQDKEALRMTCQKMETIAMEIFADHGWRFSNRICD
jgi:hypothetical protein